MSVPVTPRLFISLAGPVYQSLPPWEDCWHARLLFSTQTLSPGRSLGCLPYRCPCPHQPSQRVFSWHTLDLLCPTPSTYDPFRKETCLLCPRHGLFCRRYRVDSGQGGTTKKVDAKRNFPGPRCETDRKRVHFRMFVRVGTFTNEEWVQNVKMLNVSVDKFCRRLECQKDELWEVVEG